MKYWWNQKFNKIQLSSGCSTNAVTSSIKEMILCIVNSKRLFTLKNLLLNPIDPYSDPPESSHYGEVNSGSSFRLAKQEECYLPNHMVTPFCHFIDGLYVDEYGNFPVAAVLICCLWSNRKTRNRASTW